MGLSSGSNAAIGARSREQAQCFERLGVDPLNGTSTSRQAKQAREPMSAILEPRFTRQ
jgi:hypothetical protein